MVFRLAIRMLRDEDDAHDACQEVFLNMHRSFDTYDATRPMRPWVARVAYNACLHRLRGAMTRATSAVDPGDLAELSDDRRADPEAAAATAERADHLGAAVEELAGQDQALLILRYREGLSDAEVAEATGMAVGTVKTRIHRAKGKMRELLAPMAEEGRA
jgi:RNA polymerase sigma-70 factor (ECF subfamily)